ncbi:MAG TPA: hypothetical protein VKZ85_00690 [Woeseiaceae bacterium]|nr:hypothetical protein [Woeseiaceae bacterium]
MDTASQPTWLYWLIVGCEAAFWLVLVAALASRYLLLREGLSRGLLLSLPVLDLLLLAATAADLKNGATATAAHGLATAYVGFTVAFGGVAVRWADRHFAHRFAGGPAPPKPPDRGWPAVRHELGYWFRGIVAWSITLVLLTGLIAYVDNEANTRQLHLWYLVAGASVFFWFIFGPVWALVFPPRK